jgi:hypothetical protein
MTIDKNISAFKEEASQTLHGDSRLARSTVLAVLAVSAAAFGIITVNPQAEHVAPIARAALEMAGQMQAAPATPPDAQADVRSL